LLSASLAAPVPNPASEMTKEKYDKLPKKLVFKDVQLDMVAYCAGFYTKLGEMYGFGFQTIKGKDSTGKLKFDNDDDHWDIIITGVGTVKRMGDIIITGVGSSKRTSMATGGPSFYRTFFDYIDQKLHSKASWGNISEKYRYNIESSPNINPVKLKECNKDNSYNRDTGKWGYVKQFTVNYEKMTFTKNDPNALDPIE
jgi:hypothetical protein